MDASSKPPRSSSLAKRRLRPIAFHSKKCLRPPFGLLPQTLPSLPMLDPELKKLLCCPETHQDLHEAESTLISRLNDQIGEGVLKNRAGRAVTQKLDGGLIRADGKFLYPIRSDIPVMLIDEAIPL